MSRMLTNVEAINKANILRAKINRLTRAFRRNHPNLVCYVGGERPVKECASGYYRDKLNAHLKILEDLDKEANRLQEFGERQQGLF